MIKAKFLLAVFSVVLFSNLVFGCHPEICRRRRDVRQRNQLLQRVSGCDKKTLPWIEPLAYCLNVNKKKLVHTLKDWYEKTYKLCAKNCEAVGRGTAEQFEIGSCIDCFKVPLERIRMVPHLNVEFDVMNNCIDHVVPAMLSDELPTYTVLSKNVGNILLPELRPENNWWTITVVLPCKPLLFEFWNAYCVNSFVKDQNPSEYVLAQNDLIRSDEIGFKVTFSQQCRFELKDVQLIWDESVAAFAAPQLSSFPSTMPPRETEKGNLFFDMDYFSKLMKTPLDESYQKVMPVASVRRMSQPNRVFYTLGLEFPCEIHNMEISDRLGFPYKTRKRGRRFWVEVNSNFFLESRSFRRPDMTMFNITLDNGDANTGCLFSSNQIKITVNAKRSFLAAEANNERLQCFTCVNARSDRECERIGRVTTCNNGEVCQSEVRTWGRKTISITKQCKEQLACENNRIHNRIQCKDFSLTKVCRCCCDGNFCNRNAYHCL